MTEQRWFSVLCGVLIVAALSVTLVNTSTFASMFEPDKYLAWAWAVYIDLALVGYTIANVWLRNRGQRTGVVRFGFYWFVALSLMANIIVVLWRYDTLRGYYLILELMTSDAFLFAASIAYGASIPLSVLTFAHTIADAWGVAQATAMVPGDVILNPTDVEVGYIRNETHAKVHAARVARPEADKDAIARATGLSIHQVRRYWGAT